MFRKLFRKIFKKGDKGKGSIDLKGMPLLGKTLDQKVYYIFEKKLNTKIFVKLKSISKRYNQTLNN